MSDDVEKETESEAARMNINFSELGKACQR